MKLKFLAVLAALGFLAGCSLDGDNDNNNCYTRAYMAATAVTGPDSTTVNTPVNFNVSFKVVNSCGTFVGFQQFNTTFPRQIGATVDYTGCNCTETNTILTKPYEFKPTVAGSYILHFLTEDPNFPIVKTIVVTQ